MIFFFLILYIDFFCFGCCFNPCFYFLVYDQDIFAYDQDIFAYDQDIFAYDQDIFAFCSRIVNIIAEIFIPTRVFV